MPIKYACLNAGQHKLLAEDPEGQHPALAHRMQAVISTVPSDVARVRQTVQNQGFDFHVIAAFVHSEHEQRIVGCVTEGETSHRAVNSFLEEVLNYDTDAKPSAQTAAAAAGSTTSSAASPSSALAAAGEHKNLKKMLHQLIESYNRQIEATSGFGDDASRRSVVGGGAGGASSSAVADLIKENVARALATDPCDQLSQRSAQLDSQAAQFETTSRSFKSALCWKNIRCLFCVGVLMGIIASVVIMIRCGGQLQDCKSPA